MSAIGRFAKLNTDIQKLADRIMEDQDLCKLIYYPNTHPLDQPDINGENTILDKRLLLFTPKIPLAGENEGTQDDGTYVMILPKVIDPTRGGHYMVTRLHFDIFCHKDIRNIYYKDDSGNIDRGDRALLIMNKIEGIMQGANIGIGEDNLGQSEIIANRNTTFSGYSLWYLNVDFRNQGV